MKLTNREIKKIHASNGVGQINAEYSFQGLEIVQQWNPKVPISMDFYHQFCPEAWAVACGMKGVYQIITEPLVDFIQHLIKGQKAIEICAGLGALGRSLGIASIDRKLHLDPKARLYFDVQKNVLNQLPDYPEDIIEMTANKAFKEYKPEWTIGCWVTQKLQQGSKIGMMYGPVEEEFIERSNYIHLGSGHLDIHLKKRIIKKPHTSVFADWIVDRTSYKSESQMKIWSKKAINFDKFPNHLEFDFID